MLERDAVVSEDLQQMGHEADLAVHHGFFYVHAAEALVPGDAGDLALVRVGRERRDDEGAGILRPVGIADVDGDIRAAVREDRVLVQDRRAHIGKLAQLAVGDIVDNVRMLDDARVGRQHAGHVRPVLIQLCAHRAGHDRARHVGATAGEGMDGAVGHCAVEAGDDGAVDADEGVADGCVRGLGVKGAVCAEQDHLRRVDKGKAEIGRQQSGVQIFAAAGHIVALRRSAQVCFDGGKVRREIDLQLQLGDDIGKALPDLIERGGKILPGAGGVIAAVEQVRDLRIAGKALAGRGGDDVAAAGIFTDDGRDLFKLTGGRQRAAAEFHNDGVHKGLLSANTLQRDGILTLFSHKGPVPSTANFFRISDLDKIYARGRKTDVFLVRTNKTAGGCASGGCH